MIRHSKPIDEEVSMIERRRFSRIVYQVATKLTQDTLVVDGTIQDLSLQGLLIDCDNHHQLNHHLPVQISFQLTDSDIDIQLEASIVSTINTSVRLRIEHLDIDSISHLKRLIELNVGDDELLYREIEHLTDLGKE